MTNRGYMCYIVRSGGMTRIYAVRSCLSGDDYGSSQLLALIILHTTSTITSTARLYSSTAIIPTFHPHVLPPPPPRISPLAYRTSVLAIMGTDYTTKNYDIEKEASAHVTYVLPADEVEVVADHALGEDEATLVALV